MQFRMRSLWKYPLSSQLAAMRLIRKHRGVGRPPAHTLARLKRKGWSPIYAKGSPHCRWVRDLEHKLRKCGPAARRRARRLEAVAEWVFHYPTDVAGGIVSTGAT